MSKLGNWFNGIGAAVLVVGTVFMAQAYILGVDVKDMGAGFIQFRSDSPPIPREFAAGRAEGQYIKMPPGVAATCRFSVDTKDLAIVIVTEKYDGPSLVNIPIRDQHGNFLGSLQLEAAP